MSETSETEQSSREELNGHMTELAVRKTRETTDLMVGEVLPKLANVLANGEHTPRMLMTINRFYFKDNAIVANSLDGRGFFLDESHSKNAASTAEIVSPIDDYGFRTINIWTGDQFKHPHSSGLAELTDQYVQRLNSFVGNAAEMPIDQLRLRRFKYYQALSIMHLPLDGSGRFLGDMDTMMQMAIAQHNPEWKMELISVTGWRIGHHESWIMSEDGLVRDHILNDVWDRMIEIKSDLKGKIEEKSGKEHLRGFRDRRDFFESIGDEDEIMDVYDAALADVVHEFLELLDDDKSDNWVNHLTRDILQRRPGNRNFRYHFSDEYGRKASGIDAMVAAHRDKNSPYNYERLAQILGRSGVFDLDLIKRPEIAELTRFVMKQSYDGDREIMDWILTKNRALNRVFITRPFSNQ